jgi:hypothetical protein
VTGAALNSLFYRSRVQPLAVALPRRPQRPPRPSDSALRVRIGSMLHAVLLLLAAHRAASSSAAGVRISNVEPRTTVGGATLPAHDGGVYLYGEGEERGWFFYGMEYGLCEEDPKGGCDNHTTGACGFRTDHNVSIFRSADLSQHSWARVGSALPEGRPTAIYYRPKVLFNARTKKYVLWVNWRECLPCGLFYLTATSDSPAGPFTLAKANVTTRYKDGGDFTVFADDDGRGYLLYQSRASGHVASVELLSDDFTDSLGAVDPESSSSGLFGPKGIEAPAMFKRDGVYYALVGLDCCFCKLGSGVIVFTAASPLGPFTEHGQVGRYANKTSITKAQQNFVITVPTTSGAEGGPPSYSYLWTGDRWQSAPDGLKDHDWQTWLPLEFTDAGAQQQPGAAMIKQMVWRDSFTIDVAPAATPSAAELPPPVIGLNGTSLLAIRRLVASGSLPAPLQPALAALLRAAQVALQFKGHGNQGQHLGCPETGPWSVTAKQVTPPSGDKRDFTYISTYSWPCNTECNHSTWGAHRCQDWWRRPPDWSKCDNATGLPWIGHDGFGQSMGQHDADCSDLMASTAETLSQSYYLTGNESFAEGAAAVLRKWFVTDSTAMNPNCNFAGWQPGVANGRSSGIIATTFRWRARVTDAEVLLRGSAHWTAQDSTVFKEWNHRYLDWLLTERLARSEANSTNNHFTWFEVQALALALSAGNVSIAEQIANRIRSPDYRGRLQAQIWPNGSMPMETHRTGGATYSCMNMDALFTLATVASHTAAGKDLWTWHYPGSSGRGSIRHALDYLVAYATNSSRTWPWRQEGAVSWDKFPWNGLKLQLRIASIVYSDERYEDAIAHLPWPGATGWDNGSAWAEDVAQLLWPKISLKTTDDDAGPSVLDGSTCAVKHRWRATSESFPSGHNKPKTCPGCAGQAVVCDGCDNISPLYHLSLSVAPSRTVASALVFQKSLPPGSVAAVMPMYSPEGTGATSNMPGWSHDPGGDFDGMTNAFGVTGPAGVDILHVPACGNFSGIWWDGQIADVASRWHTFLTQFKAAGGQLEEVVLDTERSENLESLWNKPKTAGAVDCARLRLRAIQKAEHFAPVWDQLVRDGMILGPRSDPDSLWRAVGPSSADAYKNATQYQNGDIWNQRMSQRAARAWNTSIVGPAIEVYGDGLTISDYGFRTCRAGTGFPNSYGTRGCGMPGTVSGVSADQTIQGVLVGTHAAPQCYQDFHLFCDHYFLGGPRPGLAHALNLSFGVPVYPRNAFNVFRFDAFAARQTAEAQVPFKTWVGYSRMGAGQYWPNGYGLTNGSGYYAETWFHHALAGVDDFLYYNTLSYQLDGSDNQLLSDVLKELDVMVGCKTRSWVRDAPVNTHQAWMDGYLLSGMVLGDASPGSAMTRVWRFTPDMAANDSATRFVLRTKPALTLQVINNADSRSITTIEFSAGSRVVASPLPAKGRPLPSQLGLWIVETDVRKPLPKRTLCPAGGTCATVAWPAQYVHAQER